MNHDWLKIKLVKDINKLRKYNNYSYYDMYNKLKLKSSFSKKYRNILNIVSNHCAHIISSNNITISDMKDIDFDILLKIVDYDNISITELPIFNISYIDKVDSVKILKTKTLMVDKFELEFDFEPLTKIKNNQNDMFYIYDININYVRWCQEQDKNLMLNNRRKKIINLNQLS